ATSRRPPAGGRAITAAPVATAGQDDSWDGLSAADGTDWSSDTVTPPCPAARQAGSPGPAASADTLPPARNRGSNNRRTLRRTRPVLPPAATPGNSPSRR